MGDKSPKANARKQKQHAAEKKQQQADARTKQERTPAAVPGKKR